MNIYLDSSWLLRALLKQSTVTPLGAGATVYSSVLLNIECHRTIDRHLKRRLLSETEFAQVNQQLRQYIETINIIDLTSAILMRAAGPFFLPIGSLDAMHLATAMQLSESLKESVSIATFDEELALAASAHNIEVLSL